MSQKNYKIYKLFVRNILLLMMLVNDASGMQTTYENNNTHQRTAFEFKNA